MTRRSRRFRVVTTIVGVLLLVMGAAIVPAAIKAGDIRAAASTARAQAANAMSELRAGEFDQAMGSLDQARAALDEMHGHLASRSLIVARNMPLVGNELRRTASLLTAASNAAHVLGELAVDLEPVLDPAGPALMPERGRIDLDQIPRLRTAIEARLPAIAEAVAQASDDLSGLRFGTTRDQATSMVDDLTRIHSTLEDAATLLTALPGLLGADGPRQHLIVLQNLAEARSTGGLIGGFAIVRTDRGRIEVRQVESNANLKLPANTAPVAMPSWFSDRYDKYGTRRHWSNVNMHPDVPMTAPLIARLFRRTHGIEVDSVILMDPLTLERLVEVTGAIRTPDLTFEPGATAKTIMIDSYERFGAAVTSEGLTERKHLMVELAEQLFPEILRPANVFGVASAFARTAGEGHLAMWSAVNSEQQVLESLGLAGAFTSDAPLWLGLAFDNGAGNKMDAYLQTSLDISVQHTGDEALVDVVATFRLDAPDVAALPDIVTGPIASTEDLERGQARYLVAVHMPPTADVALSDPNTSSFSRIPSAGIVDAVVDAFPGRPGELRFSFRVFGVAPGQAIDVLTIPMARPLLRTGT